MIDTASVKLRIALRLLALWRERPAGVRKIERDLRADQAGEIALDVSVANVEIDRLEEIRRGGPFIAQMDRTLLPADAPTAHLAKD